MVPKPVAAVLLLFPITAATEAARKQRTCRGCNSRTEGPKVAMHLEAWLGRYAGLARVSCRVRWYRIRSYEYGVVSALHHARNVLLVLLQSKKPSRRMAKK